MADFRILSYHPKGAFTLGRHAAMALRPRVLRLGSARLSASAVVVLGKGTLLWVRFRPGSGLFVEGSWKVLGGFQEAPGKLLEASGGALRAPGALLVEA